MRFLSVEISTTHYVLPDWLTKPNFCQTGFAELTNPEDEFNQAKIHNLKEKLKTKIQGIKFRKENPVMNTWDSPADTVGPTRKF
ncbi:MAG: hypothetical protein DHS20C01_12630 [marine bacterium B5-7]|nr:MAG: hypothetical protein DHS20C01_12630 [marine bacterium B5-7]